MMSATSADVADEEPTASLRTNAKNVSNGLSSDGFLLCAFETADAMI